MGILEFITTPSALLKTFASETKVQVATIEIKGNTTISTEAIQQTLPIQPEDVITSSQLSWLIAELQEQGWFQDVRLETQQVDVPNEESVATGRQDRRAGFTRNRFTDKRQPKGFPS